MAQSRFSRTTPATPIDRATVNVSGEAASGTVVAADPTNHHRAWTPATSGYQPPTPTPPTEVELRERLGAAIDAERAAFERVDALIAAGERATAHSTEAGNALRQFDTIDDQALSSTLKQLTAGGRVEVDAALAGRIADRERARITYGAAIRAGERINADLAAARSTAAAATVAVDRFVAGVLAFAASRIADRHAALVAEASTVAEQLHAFNQWSAGRGVVLPPSVRAALGSMDTAGLMRQRDKSQWIDMAKSLRADAKVEQWP